MPETILVVEYEPRYTDRVRQALAGQPFTTAFAKDGDEALRAFASSEPKLIVLSSVVPKATTSDLIRAIRSQSALQQTPILLTVSGYLGKTPKADAQRIGASDILPKPYTEVDFLGKIQQMLGVTVAPDNENVVHPSESAGLTSNEIFGDLLSDDKPAAAKKSTKTSDDVDKMLEATLAGMRPSRKTSPGTPRPVTSPGTTRAPGSAELDKIVHDTLSGLERTQSRPKSNPPAAASATPAAVAPTAPPAAVVTPPRPASGPQPAMASQPVAAPPVAAAPVTPAPQPPPAAPVPLADKVAVSSPVIAAPVPQPAPAPVDDQEPVDGVRFGQYVLLEKIATGGMAEVWKARMRGVEGFQKIVAIKKILPHLSDNRDFIDMFIDEAKLAAQLTHNNIIHIYDLGKIQSSYYIAMEYVDGWDLKTILKKAQDHDQPLTVDLALFITSKIASALDYAHRRRDFNDQEMGLVHRDVSPQNVLISQEGDIKLCDFGIAKAASKASHTQAGALKGKLQYMSPEQAWGRTIDRRSDIFALATVLFELLTGRKLFTGENEMSILEQVREARVTPPSQINDEVTPEIDKIVLKALQKDPENRYQTAGEMARDIDQVLYTFRPTPNSADLAIYMHRLSNPMHPMHPQQDLDETVTDEGPVLTPVAPPRMMTPAPAPAALVVPQPAAAAAPPFEEAEAKKKPVALIAIAAVVILAAIGIGAFFMTRKPAGPAAKPAAVAATPAAAAPAATTSVATATQPIATTSATTTETAIDQTQVEAEVRKRLDAERQKLDQQARAQQTQTTAPAPRPAAPAPRPVQTTSAAPPPPVTETHATIAPPTQTVPPPVTETHAAAPPPAATETAPRTREGDLVTGGEGLTPARLVRLSTPEYPPLAREQRVEGLVLMSVLVSEAGKVLQVKLIRGVNKPVGLNESAEAAVRRSTFAPGMKDGVRVKSWMTVPINFKL